MDMEKDFHKAYVDLTKLKLKKSGENENFLNLVLGDDIWDKDRLIIKSGGFLTDVVIDKLLNFGIKKVKVDLLQDYFQSKETSWIGVSLKEFLQTQSALILNNNLLSASTLAVNLKSLGFKGGNIFVTRDLSNINKCFKAKKINFLFIDSNIYDKCSNCITKFCYLKNTHTFILIDQNESARKMKINNISNFKFIKKPLNIKVFKSIVLSAVNQNYLDYCLEEDEIAVS